MTLIDTGVMVALIDTGQADLHHNCLSIIDSIPGTLITTWPCFTEAMFLLGGLRGWKGRAALWRYIEEGEIVFHAPVGDEWKRVRDLMEQYKDRPMDFADASLVSLAELRDTHRIITTDSDFYFYRIHGKDSFEVINPNP